MSVEKNRREAERWFRTAEEDLETAVILKEHQKYAHACFHAQQAAEKALKALWYLKDADPRGHSVKKLIEDLAGVDSDCFKKLSRLRRYALMLDRFYIPTRYPNGLPELTPEQAFDLKDAADAVKYAGKILTGVKKWIP